MPEGNPYDPDWNPEEEERSELDGEDTERDEDEEFGEQMNELLASFEAEQEEFNDAEAEFKAKYGFVHKCRCAEDWAEGNLSVVSVCYLGMVADAMETLEGKMQELKEAKRELAELRIKLAG